MGMKKLAALVMALMLCLTAVSAMAEKVGNKDELVAALNGSVVVIELTDNITIADKLIVKRDVTIDGNGKTLTYTGSDRVIDATNANPGTNLTIKNLTVEVTSGYAQRGINYNTNGTLTLENVTVKGAGITYAVNMPSSSDGATVTITNCDLTGCIALNVWGENCTITATNTNFTSVDEATHENYAAVVLNDDGTDGAEGTEITITGGSITALDENDTPSTATSNNTDTGKIIVSDTTKVNGKSSSSVAAVIYKGQHESYGCETLQDAVDKAAEMPDKATVRLIKNIDLKDPVTVDNNIKMDLNGKKLTGKIILTKENATLTTDKGLNVKSGVEGLVAVYENGAYQLKPGYVVRFNANGGKGEMDTIEVITGGSCVLPTCGFTAPKGMVFDAWSINGVEYAPGAKIDVTGNTIVTAVWAAIPDLPQTGDNSSLMLWSAMLALAAAGFVVTRKTRLN